MALFSPLAAVVTFDDVELQFAFIVDNVVANTTGLFFIFTIETYALFFSLSLFCAWKLRTKQQTAKSTLTVCNFQFFTGFPHTYRQRPEWNRPLSLKCQLVSKTRQDCVACLVHFFMSRTVACWLFVLNTWKFHVVQTILRYWSWDQIRREKKSLFFSYTAGTKSKESEVDFLTFVPLKKKQFVRLLPFRGEKSGFVSNSVMIEENESHIWIRHSVLHFLVLFSDSFWLVLIGFWLVFHHGIRR